MATVVQPIQTRQPRQQRKREFDWSALGNALTEGALMLQRDQEMRQQQEYRNVMIDRMLQSDAAAAENREFDLFEFARKYPAAIPYIQQQINPQLGQALAQPPPPEQLSPSDRIRLGLGLQETAPYEAGNLLGPLLSMPSQPSDMAAPLAPTESISTDIGRQLGDKFHKKMQSNQAEEVLGKQIIKSNKTLRNDTNTAGKSHDTNIRRLKGKMVSLRDFNNPALMENKGWVKITKIDFPELFSPSATETLLGQLSPLNEKPAILEGIGYLPAEDIEGYINTRNQKLWTMKVKGAYWEKHDRPELFNEYDGVIPPPKDLEYKDILTMNPKKIRQTYEKQYDAFKAGKVKTPAQQVEPQTSDYRQEKWYINLTAVEKQDLEALLEKGVSLEEIKSYLDGSAP